MKILLAGPSYLTETEDEKVGGGAAITLNLLRRAIEHKYPPGQGVKDEAALRSITRINKALAKTKNEKLDALEITVEHGGTLLDLLKNMRDTGGVAGAFAHHFLDLFEYLEKLLADEKKSSEAKG